MKGFKLRRLIILGLVLCFSVPVFGKAISTNVHKVPIKDGHYRSPVERESAHKKGILSFFFEVGCTLLLSFSWRNSLESTFVDRSRMGMG